MGHMTRVPWMLNASHGGWASGAEVMAAAEQPVATCCAR